jgi:hypothetical protein
MTIEYRDTRQAVAKKKKYGTRRLPTQALCLYANTWKTKNPSPTSPQLVKSCMIKSWMPIMEKPISTGQIPYFEQNFKHEQALETHDRYEKLLGSITVPGRCRTVAY